MSEDFKAPDVVIALLHPAGNGVGAICRPEDWPLYINADKNKGYSYTLTTTSEVNTRKAVVEAFDKLRQELYGARDMWRMLHNPKLSQINHDLAGRVWEMMCEYDSSLIPQEPTQPTESTNEKN